MNFDFEQDLQINPDELDVEWLGQASLHMRYGKASSEANRKLKNAEQHVKVIRSQLIKEAKETIPKCTDTMAEAFYRDHPRHKKAKEDAIEAEYEANLLQNAVFSCSQRKTALEELVRLFSLGYFAGPSEPHNLSDRWKSRLQNARDDAQGETQNKIHERLQRNRRSDRDSAPEEPEEPEDGAPEEPEEPPVRRSRRV